MMTVFTDDEGRYLAKPLSPNTYEVRAEMNDVTRSVQNINLGVSMRMRADITLIARVQRVQRVSGIAIRAFDQYGDPLMNHPVKVYQDGWEVMTALTNDEGLALAKPLAPYTYRVAVEKDGITERGPDIVLSDSQVVDITIRFHPAQVTRAYRKELRKHEKARRKKNRKLHRQARKQSSV